MSKYELTGEFLLSQPARRKNQEDKKEGAGRDFYTEELGFGRVSAIVGDKNKVKVVFDDDITEETFEIDTEKEVIPEIAYEKPAKELIKSAVSNALDQLGATESSGIDVPS